MEIVEVRGLTVPAATAILGVRRAALSRVPHDNAPLSAELALRFEKAFAHPYGSGCGSRPATTSGRAWRRVAEIVVHGFVPSEEPGETVD